MEGFVAHKLNEYATGKLSRRALIETLTLAATTAYAADAKAAEQTGIKLALVNHISYNCPNFRQAADWYSSVLGMQVAGGREAEQRANLMFGPDPSKGGSFMVVRNAPAQPKPPSPVVIDHICYTISNWEDARIRAALKAKGVEPSGREGDLNLYDPFNYYVQLATAATENAFRRG